VSLSLLAAIAGLALLDSLNPATIGLVALILLLPGSAPGSTGRRSPVVLGSAVAVGAAVTVFVVGFGIYVAADAAAVVGGLSWVRRLAFGAAAVVVLVMGLRRLRARRAAAIALPTWFSIWTAVPLGVLVTGADLPNAFPYFIAIERMVAAGTGPGVAGLVLAGYAVLYCVPCLILLVVARLRGNEVRERLAGLYRRFGAAREVPRSIGRAAAYVAGAVALAVVAATA
jgi:hypothetical protein